MAWNWYGVKTLGVDRDYAPDGTLVEERIVLFRARSCDEAIAKAETEARTYAALPHGGNKYGQRVVHRYLGAREAFELFDPPAAGREVFSSMRVVPADVSDAAIARQMVGSERRPVRLRRKFFEAHLPVPKRFRQ